MQNNNINISTNPSTKLQLKNRRKNVTKLDKASISQPGRGQQAFPTKYSNQSKSPHTAARSLHNVKSSTRRTSRSGQNELHSPCDYGDQATNSQMLSHRIELDLYQKYHTENQQVITKPEYFGMFSQLWNDNGADNGAGFRRYPDLTEDDVQQLTHQASSSRMSRAQPSEQHGKSAHFSISIADLMSSVEHNPAPDSGYFSQIRGDQNGLKQESLPQSTPCNLLAPSMSSALRTQRSKARLMSIEEIDSNIVGSGKSAVLSLMGSRTAKCCRSRGKQPLKTKQQQPHKVAGRKKYNDDLFFASDLIEEQKAAGSKKDQRGHLNLTKKGAKNLHNINPGAQRSTLFPQSGMNNAQLSSYATFQHGNNQSRASNDSKLSLNSRYIGNRGAGWSPSSQPARGSRRPQTSSGNLVCCRSQVSQPAIISPQSQSNTALTVHPRGCSQVEHQIRENEQAGVFANKKISALLQVVNQNLGQGARSNVERSRAAGRRQGALTKRPLLQRVSRRPASAAGSKTSSSVTRGFSTSRSNLTNSSSGKELHQTKSQTQTAQNGSQIQNTKIKTNQAQQQNSRASSLSQGTLETIKKLQEINRTGQTNWRGGDQQQSSANVPPRDRRSRNFEGQMFGGDNIINYNLDINQQDVIQQNEDQRWKQNAPPKPTPSSTIRHNTPMNRQPGPTSSSATAQYCRVIPPATARARPLLVSTVDGRPLPEGWHPEGKVGHDAGWSAQRGEDVQAHLANYRDEAAGLVGASQRRHGLQKIWASSGPDKPQAPDAQQPKKQGRIQPEADRIIRLNQDQVHLKNTPRALQFPPEKVQKAKKSTSEKQPNHGNSVFREF